MVSVIFSMVDVIFSMVKVIFLMVDVIFPMVNVISLMVNDIFSMVKTSCVLMVNNVKGFNSYLGQKSFIRQEAGRRFFHHSYSELFLAPKSQQIRQGRRFVRCFNFQAKKQPTGSSDVQTFKLKNGSVVTLELQKLLSLKIDLL